MYDEDALLDQARAHGVDAEVFARMLEGVDELVEQVRRDPRAWGFDLLPVGVARRSVEQEFAARVRIRGPLAASFLQGHGPLLACAPDPLTVPSGASVASVLVDRARVDEEMATELAQLLRTTIQARLGGPLDRAAVEHAVREVAWDREVDAAQITPMVLHALAGLC